MLLGQDSLRTAYSRPAERRPRQTPCCLCRFNSLTPDELAKLALGAARAAQSLGLNLQASDVGVTGVFYTVASGAVGRRLQARQRQP